MLLTLLLTFTLQATVPPSTPPLPDPTYLYQSDRIAHRRAASSAAYGTSWNELVAWQEDLFAYGPSLEVVQAHFSDAGFFHVEIFQSLPGRHAALYKEREMEHVYLAELERPENLIFVKDQGAPWDVFTIGFYRDLKHFAESADLPLDREEAAAKIAGFESVYTISPFLRSLIQQHHDTLAVAIR